MSEEAKMIEQEQNVEVLTAYNTIPYSLINSEIDGTTKDTLDEFNEISKYYRIYKKGSSFNPEGSNGDYVPAALKYKMAASLINKEARFLFAETPDIIVEPKSSVGEITNDTKDALVVLSDLVETILDKNNFPDILLKSAKDCFIGKRVGWLVNFNEDDGVTITFLKSTQFLYETKTGNPNIINKFVAFIIVKDSIKLSDKKIFKKKYTLEDGKVYLEEALYDGSGSLIEEVTKRTQIMLDIIPAGVIINDGLTGEVRGESEIEYLDDYESWYSKLNNADIDAGRKSMNPTRYTVDMDSNSTKNLSTSAGSFWDLGSDQNLDHPSPQVGMLEPNMNYSNSLKSTLDRIKTTAYEQVDSPNITLESMQGAITSGKSLKALYWPLIVRCKEKMKTWEPQLQNLIGIIIEGAFVYPNCVKRYIEDALVPVSYRVNIQQNIPLQEDEIEEKNMDLAEVESGTMSRKAYMKKWRDLTDDEAMEELEQIALERQIIEDSTFSGISTNSQELDAGTLNSNANNDIIEDEEALNGANNEQIQEE